MDDIKTFAVDVYHECDPQSNTSVKAVYLSDHKEAMKKQEDRYESILKELDKKLSENMLCSLDLIRTINTDHDAAMKAKNAEIDKLKKQLLDLEFKQPSPTHELLELAKAALHYCMLETCIHSSGYARNVYLRCEETLNVLTKLKNEDQN